MARDLHVPAMSLFNRLLFANASPNRFPQRPLGGLGAQTANQAMQANAAAPLANDPWGAIDGLPNSAPAWLAPNAALAQAYASMYSPFGFNPNAALTAGNATSQYLNPNAPMYANNFAAAQTTPNAAAQAITPNAAAAAWALAPNAPVTPNASAANLGGGFTPNAAAAQALTANAQPYGANAAPATANSPARHLPFFNPATGGLDAGQLANAFAGAGLGRGLSHRVAKLVSDALSPNQFFKPLWNALGGQGAPNLGQLGQAYGPQQGNAALAADVKGALNSGNATGWKGPRPPVLPQPGTTNPGGQTNPVVTNPGGQTNPVVTNPGGTTPPPVTPEVIDGVGQTNQRHILNRGNTVVRELYGRDAVVVDNNTTGSRGKIDSKDFVEYTDAQGQKVRKAIGDQKFREIQMRTHTVEGAKILDDARKAGQGMGFNADMQNPTVNDQYWKVVDGRVQVRDGVNASAAVDDVFKNPNKYSLDCAAAAHLVGLRSIRNTIGAGDFDRSHQNLSVQGWTARRQTEAANGSTFTRVSGDAGRRDAIANRLPGDVGYFKNPDNVSVAWQGENVIYLGNGQYFGHPGGIKSKDEWVNWMNDHARRPGATQEAYLSSLNGDWGANRWAEHDRNTNDSNAL